MQGDIVARHDHLDVLGQLDGAGDIGRPKEELGLVVGEEGGVAAALIFVQRIHLRLKLLEGLHGARLAEHLQAKPGNVSHQQLQGWSNFAIERSLQAQICCTINTLGRDG